MGHLVLQSCRIYGTCQSSWLQPTSSAQGYDATNENRDRQIYIPDFIAANQEDRADNLIHGTKQEMLEQIRRDIRDFKQSSGVDKVIILWTANTERFSEIIPGMNDTADHLLQSIRRNESEISPSTLFAVASILEGVRFSKYMSGMAIFRGWVNVWRNMKIFP